MKILKKSKTVVLLTILSILTSLLPLTELEVKAAGKENFWVEFVDVGQGDCAIVQCNGHYMMIDGGPSKASSKVYTILKNKGINNIDLMIATHPDEDHIGGLSGALNYSTVGTVLSPVTFYETRAFTSLTKYITKQGKSLTVPAAGDVYKLGCARINIIGPINSGSEINNQSIVLKVTYGSTSFLFTGDAEAEEEESILKKFKGLECDVLKVGHHGSNSSNTISWIRATAPKNAVISVGNNSYGHPTQEILNKLTQAGSTIYRTDLQGDIIFYSDGQSVYVETEKNAASPAASLNSSASETSLNTVDTPNVSGDSTNFIKGNDIELPDGIAFVLNTNTKKFHIPSCASVKDMSAKNMQFSNASVEELIAYGYNPCQRCCSSVSISPFEEAVEPSKTTEINSQFTIPVATYVLNTNTKKFHYPSCSSVGAMSAKNRQDVSLSRDDIISQGYIPCKRCNP